MRDDLLDDGAHLERVAVLLVDEDVASGQRRLIQMPDEGLLAQWKCAEPVGV